MSASHGLLPRPACFPPSPFSGRASSASRPSCSPFPLRPPVSTPPSARSSRTPSCCCSSCSRRCSPSAATPTSSSAWPPAGRPPARPRGRRRRGARAGAAEGEARCLSRAKAGQEGREAPGEPPVPWRVLPLQGRGLRELHPGSGRCTGRVYRVLGELALLRRLLLRRSGFRVALLGLLRAGCGQGTGLWRSSSLG